jgi:hypothetical protein
VDPPGGAGVIREGYGDPAPVLPRSGTAIGAGFQSADAGCAPASIAIVTSAPATSRFHPRRRGPMIEDLRERLGEPSRNRISGLRSVELALYGAIGDRLD